MFWLVYYNNQSTSQYPMYLYLVLYEVYCITLMFLLDDNTIVTVSFSYWTVHHSVVTHKSLCPKKLHNILFSSKWLAIGVFKHNTTAMSSSINLCLSLLHTIFTLDPFPAIVTIHLIVSMVFPLETFVFEQLLHCTMYNVHIYCTSVL